MLLLQNTACNHHCCTYCNSTNSSLHVHLMYLYLK